MAARRIKFEWLKHSTWFSVTTYRRQPKWANTLELSDGKYIPQLHFFDYRCVRDLNEDSFPNKKPPFEIAPAFLWHEGVVKPYSRPINKNFCIYVIKEKYTRYSYGLIYTVETEQGDWVVMKDECRSIPYEEKLLKLGWRCDFLNGKVEPEYVHSWVSKREVRRRIAKFSALEQMPYQWLALIK